MKNINRIFLLVCSLMFLVFGQAMAAERQYDIVRSNGSVTQEVAPDTAFVNMGVMTQGKTAEEARAINAEIANNVISSLENLGIAREDIKTVGYSVHPDYSDYVKGKRSIVGYTINYSLSVKVENLDRLGAVIDQMFADGANTFNGVTFTLSNRKALERELLALALKNAEEKASIVANAGGRTLGRLMEANIGGIGGMEYRESNYDTIMLSKASMDSAAPTQIMGGTLKVSANVDASFELL